MSIRLRPHHLLCMLTFMGEGYSTAFVANFAAIINRVRDGEPIHILNGPDDICAPLSVEQAGAVHCTQESVRRRDDIARQTLGAIPELAPLFAPAGCVIDATTVAALRNRFTSGSVRGACEGCEWSPLCTQIVADAYAATHL